MKLLRHFLTGAAVSLVLAACGSDNSRPVVDLDPPPPPPVSFTTFVKDRFAATADNTDPVLVDTIDFAFDSDDDPTAFDDLLP